MNQLGLYKFISGTLIILVILSFFLGFYLDESSFGAGGYNGDFEHIYLVNVKSRSGLKAGSYINQTQRCLK